ncbi:SRPBCC family protein [Streptomyces benahoarensis]|uniref:SRPBCC family protein n=1 Tax=Streptomyces benahoarensis TaxID=2595054 RepID=A0A553ZRR8_9ACTN|nr:SRPBCC family protein [Streptomyces benahoarensis]TSB32774.1 SRPBCC family protein [Streptomyces benahoarensis]TSB44169.1 SRPBCC family protein [Streptomyces benahoarensis]
MMESATGKLTDLAQGLENTAGGGEGDLLDVGKRVLGGENPVKAFVSEKAGTMKDKVVDSVKSAFGGGSGKSGSVKVTNIVEAVDIGMPLRTMYDRWTEIEEFSSFTKGVTGVSRRDDVASDWKLKVAFSHRSWQATAQEQVPDDRMVWTSEGAKGTTHGAISFHELAPALTRVIAVVEYTPSGFFEKTGNLWRAQGRRLRLDLKHFQRYVTLTDDEEAEGWRGEIRGGEVVRSHEEGLKDDEDEAGSAGEDGEPQGAEDDDYDAREAEGDLEEDEEPEDETEE